MRAILSLMGVYNYDNTILDNISLPAEWNMETRNNFVKKLMLDTAELEILYPEPAILKEAIGLWSAAELPQWEKLYKTTVLEYNPIWNKDGTITESEGIERANQYSEGRTGTQTDSETGSGTGTEKDFVFGYNSDTAAQSSQIDTEQGSTNKSTSDISENNDHSGTDSENRNYTRRETGNIGVTTTQKMIQEERDIDKFNLQDYIINCFKNRFCIMIY